MNPSLLLLAAAASALLVFASGPISARLAPLAAASAAVMSERLPPFVSRDRRRLIVGLLVGPLAACALAGFASGHWWVGLLPLPALVGLAAVGPPSLARRRRGHLSAQMAATTDLLGASCESGLSFRRALDLASADLPEPMSGELREVGRGIGFGGRVDDALHQFAERVGTADAHLFAAVVAVQLRSGGDLGASLRTLARRMSRRERVSRELRGMTAQARSTATIVAVLPIAAAILAEVAAPGSMTGMLTSPIGRAIVAASLVLQGLGLVMVRLVSRVPT